jgi:hypothetical protein
MTHSVKRKKAEAANSGFILVCGTANMYGPAVSSRHLQVRPNAHYVNQCDGYELLSSQNEVA